MQKSNSKEYVRICTKISRLTGHSFKNIVKNYWKLITEGFEVDEALDALEDYYLKGEGDEKHSGTDEGTIR